MQCPKAALFDLDDTLAPSFEALSPKMVEKVRQVLDLMPTAIITGRDFKWMSQDFLPLFAGVPHADRFYLFPEGSAQCFQWDGKLWNEIYGETITDEERAKITQTIKDAVRDTGVLEGMSVFGEQFVQKKAMVAFAALGVKVPTDLKYSWDPGNIRRKTLRDAIAKALPEYDVLMGGATSTDVTKSGINKAYGVRWFAERLNIPTSEMLYVGDALEEGGNDFVVIETGVQTRPTSGPEQTLKIIDEILTSCAN